MCTNEYDSPRIAAVFVFRRACYQLLALSTSHTHSSGMSPKRLGLRRTMPRVNFAPTSASARKAHAAGELADWSQSFLRGQGGNLGIADPLRERDDDDVYILAEVGLN